jgi:hypothetical protein
MSYLQTILPDKAEGKIREIYQADLKAQGYLPKYTSAMSLRPLVIETWRAFLGAIRGNMRLRTYELVTIAAAGAVGCRY